MIKKTKDSEKLLEKKLDRIVKELGGWTLKLLPTFVSGLPDRLVLYKGRALFVELKTTDKRARPDQLRIHKKLERLGFEVYVIDTSEGVDKFINRLIHLI